MTVYEEGTEVHTGGSGLSMVRIDKDGNQPGGSGNQSVADGENVTVSYNVTTHTTGSALTADTDNDRITFDEAGYYWLKTVVRWDSLNANSKTGLYMTKDYSGGLEVINEHWKYVPKANSTFSSSPDLDVYTIEGAGTVNADAGDYVQTTATQENGNGNSHDITGFGGGWTYMIAIKLA